MESLPKTGVVDKSQAPVSQSLKNMLHLACGKTRNSTEAQSPAVTGGSPDPSAVKIGLLRGLPSKSLFSAILMNYCLYAGVTPTPVSASLPSHTGTVFGLCPP